MLTLAARPRSATAGRSLRFAGAVQQQQRRTMFIQTMPTPNDDALKFLPSQEVLPATSGTLEYVSGRDAHSSPLARKLFAVDGIKSVMFGSDFITVEKDPEASWTLLKPEIFSILTEHLTAGLPVVVEGTEAAQDTMPSEEDDEVVSMIKELIDTRIRPAIQEDGGDIQYRGFTDKGVVLLKLQGACRSCDSSSVTLKHGIESMLMHYVEEVTGVEQVLDPEEEASLKQFEKLENKLKTASSAKDNGLEAPPAL
jgi:Fe-S cluster biogenesis protein NfuA